MMLTIIPNDKFVNIDGQKVIFDFTINPNYHPIHWDGINGIIETIKGKNIILTDIDEFKDIVTGHADAIAQDLAQEELLIAEYNSSLNVWKRQLMETENPMVISRGLEELLDNIINGTPISNEVSLWVSGRKLIRGQKP